MLLAHRCLFAGGTVIALRYGEYRESVDVDFLVSDIAQYRELRTGLTGPDGLGAITRAQSPPLQQAAAIRADQYGIRTRVHIDGQPIKLRIVHEARIALEVPGEDDAVCGVPALTPLDMAASKKSEAAYGAAILRDLRRAIERMGQRRGWLERCMQAMAMTDPPALVWQRIRRLSRVLS